MQELRASGVDNGYLVAVADDGSQYRVPVEEVLQRLRQATPDPGSGRKIAPKEIQAHIRAGMSAFDVSTITGAPLDYVQRFEGPVLAEREYVVESALNVPVHTAGDTDPLAQGTTFGAVIRERLMEIGAANERWSSWKEQGGGWVVKLTFASDDVDHDARWEFEPKKLSLAPLNSEARTLSQQGDVPQPLIPRLRAVEHSDAREADTSRFDSGAFHVDHTEIDTGPLPRPTAQRAPEPARDLSQTADLLEALRRRRGEREAAATAEEEQSQHPSTGVRLVDVPLDLPGEDEPEQSPRSTQPQPLVPRSASRKGRASMPTWDEIVFGARPDDDLA